jgi:hypothetical protein
MYNSDLCKLAQEQNLVDDHDFFMYYIIIFLNKLTIVENAKKKMLKKLEQNAGPWWCILLHRK